MASTPTPSDPRRVEYRPLSELRVDPRNPRSHAEEQIADSVGRFGVLDLITLDERTGLIVSGHGRRKTYMKMEERGDSPPEGVKVAEDGTWLVPVVTGWASRTDSEARAALIALNRTNELGGWVDNELLDLLEELQEDDEETGLVGVGFTLEDLDDLIVKVGEEDNGLPDGFEEADLGGRDSPGIASYTLIFDDEEQLREWQTFLRWLNKRDEDDRTVAALVMEYVNEGEFDGD